jgi:hypothetical protein
VSFFGTIKSCFVNFTSGRRQTSSLLKSTFVWNQLTERATKEHVSSFFSERTFKGKQKIQIIHTTRRYSSLSPFYISILSNKEMQNYGYKARICSFEAFQKGLNQNYHKKWKNGSQDLRKMKVISFIVKLLKSCCRCCKLDEGPSYEMG